MQIKVVCGTVIINENKLVIVQEAKGFVHGLWNFPAGRLEDEEKLENCAIREAKEECGLDVKIIGLIGIYQYHSSHNNNVIAFYFAAKPKSLKLKPQPIEILDTKWINFEDFFKLNEKELRSPHLKTILNDYLENQTNSNILKSYNA